MYIDQNGHIVWWLTMMESQQLLTLHWHSFSRWVQGAVHFPFCLSTQPIFRLWLFATCHPPGYPRYMTNNHWHSIDTHFHDGAGRVLQSVLPIKDARNSFMTVCNLSAVWLPRTHDQKLFTLRWHTFSNWGRNGVALCFAYNGGQKFLYHRI